MQSTLVKCVFFTGGQREEVREKKEGLRLSVIGRAPEYICRQKRWVGWLVESGVKDGLFLKVHLYCELDHLGEIEK